MNKVADKRAYAEKSAQVNRSYEHKWRQIFFHLVEYQLFVDLYLLISFRVKL